MFANVRAMQKGTDCCLLSLQCTLSISCDKEMEIIDFTEAPHTYRNIPINVGWHGRRFGTQNQTERVLLSIIVGAAGFGEKEFYSFLQRNSFLPGRSTIILFLKDLSKQVFHSSYVIKKRTGNC